MLIFIAGPYGKRAGAEPAVIEKNIDVVCKVGQWVAELGDVPVIPHLWHRLVTGSFMNEEMWLNLSVELMLQCGGVIRLPGDSKGADAEVGVAQKAGVPVMVLTASSIEWPTMWQVVRNLRAMARVREREAMMSEGEGDG